MISFEKLTSVSTVYSSKTSKSVFFSTFFKTNFFKHHHLPFREPALFSELFLEKIIVVRIWSEEYSSFAKRYCEHIDAARNTRELRWQIPAIKGLNCIDYNLLRSKMLNIVVCKDLAYMLYAILH